MLSSSQSTSTLNSELSIFSSIPLFTVSINFQSSSLEQLRRMSCSSSLSFSVSRLENLLLKSARLVNRLAIVAFRIPILKGFTTYSSAPVFRPSRIFFSALSAVNKIIGIWEVSISFENRTQFVTLHFGHHDIRDDQFRFIALYDG